MLYVSVMRRVQIDVDEDLDDMLRQVAAIKGQPAVICTCSLVNIPGTASSSGHDMLVGDLTLF
jgi:hypothetical protein